MLVLLVFLPLPLDAARSCPVTVHRPVNGTNLVELKGKPCPPSFRYCTVHLRFNGLSTNWTVNKLHCTSTCVASNNTSGFGVQYIIGCCNSSLCASPSDFFGDIKVNISWPHRAPPIQTSSTIQPTPVASTSIDGRSSSSTTFSPSVSDNKIDYKPCKNCCRADLNLSLPYSPIIVNNVQ